MKNPAFFFSVSISIFLIILGFLIISKVQAPKMHTATGIAHKPIGNPSPTPPALCTNNQLTASASAQGGAGNIFATLTLTNTGDTACSVTLGKTVTATFDAKNIMVNDKQTMIPKNFVLAPLANAYSQVHYPNGPQCQSPIKPVPITFTYKTDQTAVTFDPIPQGEKLIVQACSAPTEKTVVDIWPLSKAPITQ